MTKAPRNEQSGLQFPQWANFPHADLCRLLPVLYLLLATEVWLLGHFAGRLSGDSVSYLALAESLVAGRGLVEPGPDGGFLPNLIRPPGYPAFLAFFRLLFGDTLDAPVLAQAVLICLSIETVRRRLAVSVGPQISLALPVLALLCPGFLVHAGRISSEAPATFLLMVGLELFLRGRDRPNLLLGAGALVALGGLFRQNLIVAIPLLCVIQLVQGGIRSGGIWRLILGAVLVLSPWTIRNYQLSGVVSPVSALPEQYRFTYHADVLTLDAFARDGWESLWARPAPPVRSLARSPGTAAREALLLAHSRAIARTQVGSPPGNVGTPMMRRSPRPDGPVAILSTGVSPWGTRKAIALLRALNEETRRLVDDLGAPRVLASRIGLAIPRTWFTGPEMYPDGPGRWIGALAALIQLAVMAALLVRAREALGVTTLVFSALMLGLVCGDILRYPVGTTLTVPILGWLAARSGAATGVWAAVSLQLVVVLSARHAEFRYVTPHYPLVLALAVEAVTRRRGDVDSQELLSRRLAAEQLKCPDG